MEEEEIHVFVPTIIFYFTWIGPSIGSKNKIAIKNQSIKALR